MGDGRYYTYEQFFNIVFLLAIFVFIIISTVLNYYKNTKSKGGKYITTLFVLLDMIVLARFIEEIIASKEKAFNFRYMQTILFIITCFILIIYLIRYVIATYFEAGLRNKLIKTLIYSAYLFLGIILLLIVIYDTLLNQNIMIIKYSFFNVRYTWFYLMLQGLCCVCFISIAIGIHVIKVQKQRNNSIIMSNQSIVLVIIGLFAIPIVINVISMVYSLGKSNRTEMIIYLAFAAGINMLAAFFIPQDITPFIFANINDMILDYVVIIDKRGKIIYKNGRISNSQFFSEVNQLERDKINQLFSNKVEEKEKFNIKYFQYTVAKENNYFSCQIKEIKHQQKYMGAIITLTDITQLIEMLNVIEKQKKNSQLIHKKLEDYSKQIYQLEKEKEINALLEEITSTQEQSLLVLQNEIKKLMNEEDDSAYKEKIDKAIDAAKENLADVRHAVSAYKGYYGGK